MNHDVSTSLSSSCDAYEVLGIHPSANASEIRAAYLRLAREHHPDKVRSHSQGGEQMQRIVQAYEVLHDTVSRACYDEERAAKQRRNVPVRIAETVPLECMEAVEQPTMHFQYPCRCGQAYVIAPDALVQENGYVGCMGCSETIHVVWDEDGDDDGDSRSGEHIENEE